MGRFVTFIYGVVAYGLFLATFLYAIGFVENLLVPKSIDPSTSDPAEVGPVGAAILINVLLLGLFGGQHAIMARPEFKAKWTKIVPVPAERSTFVLATCVCLGLIFWQWRPMPEIVWDVQQPVLRMAIFGVSYFGFGLVLYSSFLIDHFDLFGLRQVVLHLRGIDYVEHPFMERSVYRLVRHPLMTGFLLAFWAAPTMTQGHLLFAVVTGAYIVLSVIFLEERDLRRLLGEDYEQYCRRTPRFFPRPWKSAAASDHQP